jgi:hypothetical protein
METQGNGKVGSLPHNDDTSNVNEVGKENQDVPGELRLIGGGGGGFFDLDGGGGGGPFLAPVLASVDQPVVREGIRPNGVVGESERPLEWTLLLSSSATSIARLTGRRVALANIVAGSVVILGSLFDPAGEYSRARVTGSSVVTDRWYRGLAGESVREEILGTIFGAGSSSTGSKRSAYDCAVLDRGLVDLRPFAFEAAGHSRLSCNRISRQLS